jgi:hypothetical protein
MHCSNPFYSYILTLQSLDDLFMSVPVVVPIVFQKVYPWTIFINILFPNQAECPDR